MNIKIKKLHDNARLPEYKTSHSAGADIYACLDSMIEIQTGQTILVPTGFAMEIPVGFEAQIRPRSGLALKGVTLANSPGTIDADYRGEVKIILHYQGEKSFAINHGDRIAQMVIARVEHAIFDEADELSDTERGTGGFGSTGR